MAKKDTDDYKSISLSASTSLSTLSTATEAAVLGGVFEIVKALEGTRGVVINYIEQISITHVVSDTVPDELKDEIKQLAKKIEEHNVPKARVDICKEGLDRCLASGSAKTLCWTNYSVCLANCFISFHFTRINLGKD